ncbi:MAG: hypothetical protein ACRDTJ_13490 [Pseudonocardiaceae bacterium]
METHTAQQLEIDSLASAWSGEALGSDPILRRLLTEPEPAPASAA